MSAPPDPFDPGKFSTDPDLAWTLPAPYYHAPEVYAAQAREIFAKSWRMVGHLTQLAKPGEYLARFLPHPGERALIVLPGRDEE